MNANQSKPLFLSDLRILVVEDDFLLAMELESLLKSRGCTVLGPVPTIAGGVALLDGEKPDAALLDLNLNGTMSTPLAERLSEHGVPFVILSGYGEDRLGEPVLQGAPFLAKPCNPTEILKCLQETIANGRDRR